MLDLSRPSHLDTIQKSLGRSGVKRLANEMGSS